MIRMGDIVSAVMVAAIAVAICYLAMAPLDATTRALIDQQQRMERTTKP